MIVPNLLLGVGIAFSIVFPERFPARALRRDIERNTKPFGSDAPVFPDEPPKASDEDNGGTILLKQKVPRILAETGEAKGVQLADGQGLDIFVPSKVDSSLARPGHHVVTMMTLLPKPEAATWHRNTPAHKAARRRDETIAQAETLLPGLSEQIITADAAPSATVTRYTGAPVEAIYGSAHHVTRLHH